MKSRALKEAAMPEMKMKPKSDMQMMKDMHKEGREMMMSAKEMMMRGKAKMLGAKMMMGGMSKKTEE